MSPIACERTRSLVSSGLDGPLHDLERRFLEAHLSRCTQCRMFASEAEWFTDVMRSAQLETPPPIALPQRRRRIALRPVASVASVAVVLVVAVSVALEAPRPQASDPTLVAPSLGEGPVAAESLRLLFRGDLENGRVSWETKRSERSLGAVKPLLQPTG